MENNLLLVLCSGVFALVFAFWKTSWINKQDEGSQYTKPMRQFHNLIKQELISSSKPILYKDLKKSKYFLKNKLKSKYPQNLQ